MLKTIISFLIEYDLSCVGVFLSVKKKCGTERERRKE